MSECNCNCSTQVTAAEKEQQLRILCVQLALQYGQDLAFAEKMYQYTTTGTVPVVKLS